MTKYEENNLQAEAEADKERERRSARECVDMLSSSQANHFRKSCVSC
jgi:hypothetical protein